MGQVSRIPGRHTFSVIQVVAGSAAAATAALAASVLGVAGTVLGAALVSAAITVLAAVYDHSMRQAREKMVLARASTLVGADSGVPEVLDHPSDVAHREEAQDLRERTLIMEPLQLEDESGYRWGHVAVAALLIFGLAMAAITAVEIQTGRPISSLWSSDDVRGTSLGGTRQEPMPGPTVTRTVTAQPAGRAAQPAEPSPTPHVTVTIKAAPSRPTPGATVTVSGTPRPAATVTVTVSPTPSSPGPSPTGSRRSSH